MRNPLVTVITPTYNHARWISACIDSVLSQTYPKWEQIIVDDASTDNTAQIVRGYCLADTRITYIRHDINQGPWQLAQTYNDALQVAKGDFVAILEGDDLWPSHKLQTQVGWHLAHPELVLSCGALQQIDQNSTVFRIPKKFRGIMTTEALLEGILLRQIFPGPVTTMVNRAPLEHIGGFQSAPNFPATDLPTFLALLLGHGKVRCEDAIMGYWRVQPEQVTQHYFESMDTTGLQLKFTTLSQSTLSITSEQVHRAHQPVVMRTKFHQLRMALIKRDQTTAYRLALNLLRGGNKRQRVLAAYALILATLGGNMERLIKAAHWINNRLFHRMTPPISSPGKPSNQRISTLN